MVTALAIVVIVVFGVSRPDDPVFKKIEIEDAYREYLINAPLMMEVPGAKGITCEDGAKVVISVAATPVNDKSAKDRLRMLRVCEAKALASVVGEQNGVEVYHAEKHSEEIIVTREEKESASSVSEYTSLTKTQIRGHATSMRIIGQWYSEDETVFYLAIGMRFNKQGERVDPFGKTDR